MSSKKSLSVLFGSILLYGMLAGAKAQNNVDPVTVDVIMFDNDQLGESNDRLSESYDNADNDSYDDSREPKDNGGPDRSGMGLFVEPVPLRGFIPNHYQLGSPIDNIDVYTGKLNLTIPLGSLPNGRGGIGYNLNLHYESNIYDMVFDEIPTGYDYTGHPNPPFKYALVTPSSETRGGWRYSDEGSYHIVIDAITENIPFGVIPSNDIECSSMQSILHNRQRLILPDGSSNILYLRNDSSTVWPITDLSNSGFYPYGDPCVVEYFDWPALPPANPTWYTRSGTHIFSDTTYLYFADGRRVERRDQYYPVSNTLKEYDSNGNYIEHKNSHLGCLVSHTTCTTEVSNETNQKIVIERGAIVNNWRRDTVTIPGPDGDHDIVYSIDWEFISVGNNVEYINYSGPLPFNFQYYYPKINNNLLVIRYIQLPFEDPVPLGTVPPDHNSYKFEYDGATYYCGKFTGGYYGGCQNVNASTTMGLLSYIRTPSGAEYHYDYQYAPYILSDSDYGEVEALVKGAYVETKTVTYDTGDPLEWTFGRVLDANYVLNVTVTNPDGGKTKYHYKNFYVRNPNPTKIIIEDVMDDGVTEKTLRERIRFGDISCPPTKEIESIFDSNGNGIKSAITTYSRDVNGNLLKKIEYDWVSYGTEVLDETENASLIKRKTTYDYYIPSGTDYKAPLSTVTWPKGGPRRLDAVKRVTVFEINSKTGVLEMQAATEYEYDNPYTKGNVLKEKHWDNAKPGALSFTPSSNNLPDYYSQVFTYSYDSYGNVTDIYEPSVSASAADKPRTHITYDSTNSHVIKVETGYGTDEKRTMQYDWSSNGVALVTKKDLDNNLMTDYIYDNTGRILAVVDGSGANDLRGTWTYYDDPNRKVMVAADLEAFGDGRLQTITHYDQLGRVKLVQQLESGSALTSNPNDGIKVKTIDSYPTGGRMVVTTTPYRSLNDSTLEWSCTQYDTLGRIELVSTFKGSTPPESCDPPTTSLDYENLTGVTRMSYDAEETTITDPDEKTRRQKVDVFGRLIQVIEDPSNLNYVTTYEYGTLDNLTKVTQGTQTRTFDYSSLSRLLSATNPESGMTSYTYHDSGDLKTKTDARDATSTLTYDVLHRVKTKTYSDTTPDVTYTYHMTANGSVAPNIGQLKSVSTSVATTNYNYNTLGQVAASSQAITGINTKTFAYEWYLNGVLKKQTYPSGKVVNYAVDDAGRTEKVYTGSTDYADLTVAAVGTDAYEPDGRIAKMLLGNGLYETRDYHTPGTPTVYQLGTDINIGDVTQIEYDFKPYKNNGNVQKQRIKRPILGTSTFWEREQDYTYDAVNRLLTANEKNASNNANVWSRTYGYDRFGNRWVASSTGLANSSSPTEPTDPDHYSAADNRLSTGTGNTYSATVSGVNYDAAGNQTLYNGMALGYDAEGRNTTASGNGVNVTFTYDGEGRRVKKTAGGITTYYVYNALGQLAAEYTNENTPAGTSYLFTDMLGSVRTVTDGTGTVINCYDYLPFGRLLSASDNGRNVAGLNGCYPQDPNNATSPVDEKFTGKPRDNETGLDYFDARYFSSPLGRFTSPDPENAGASTNDPQSWNAYAYARNNPLMYTDPDGMRYQVCWDENGVCHEMSDPDYLSYKAAVIDPIGYIAGKGIIYQKDVVGFEQLGTVKYLMSDEMWELMQGTQRAKPFVEAAGIASALLTGGFAALNYVAGAGFIETLGPIATASVGTVSSVGNKIQDSTLLKSIRSFERQIAIHVDKLNTYRANPLKFDNNELLKNAPNDAIRQKIIQGRIDVLEREIQMYKNEIEKILKNLWK